MKTTGTTPLVHVLAMVCMTLTACTGHAQQQQESRVGPDTLATDTASPRTEVHVNKEYDADGNLIAYDSTYSTFYSSRTTDPALMDSLFRDFRPGFNKRFPFMTDPGFNDLFFRDSLLYPDFFHDDFFRKRMELNDRWMQQMIAEMDSMKNAYFRERAVKPPRPGDGPH